MADKFDPATTVITDVPAAPMLPAAQHPQDIALSLINDANGFLTGLLRPWNAYQIAIAAGLVIAAYLLGKLVGPLLYEWMRSRTGWPTWRMRTMVIIHRRLKLILFVMMIWPTVWIMREITWPSRSYMLGILADLALAWLAIVFLTRLVNNPLLRLILRYSIWSWVMLSILGLTEDVQELLNSIAVDIGDLHLTLWLTIQSIFILGAMFAIARFLTRSSGSRIRRNTDISPSMQVLMVKFSQVGFYGAAFFIGLQVVGVDLTGLAFLSGAIGLGLGFGLQKVVSNLVSGVIILLDKSIKPGDVISLGETFGWIEALGARYVSVVTRDGKEYLIPNEDLITGQVVNWSHSNDYVRLDIFFGTSYHDNPHRVRQLAVEAAQNVDRVLAEKPPVCHIVNFGDSSVDFVLRFWIKDPTGGLTNIRGNVYLALWDSFQVNGITLPFPQREVTLLTPTPVPAAD